MLRKSSGSGSTGRTGSGLSGGRLSGDGCDPVEPICHTGGHGRGNGNGGWEAVGPFDSMFSASGSMGRAGSGLGEGWLSVDGCDPVDNTGLNGRGDGWSSVGPGFSGE